MRRDYFRNERREMRSLLPRTADRVLEIGCGEGQFASALHAPGGVWGIEPDPLSAQTASQRMTRVLPVAFEEARIELPYDYFDLIICNDVIEHMDDHDVFLSQIQTHLTPSGVLVGSVPNVRYYRNLFDLLFLGDWHYRDAGVLDRTHKRFFTLRSLRRSLNDAGFIIERLHGINPKLSLDLSRRQAHYTLFGFAMTILSLGLWRDITFMQLAFSARRRAEPV